MALNLYREVERANDAPGEEADLCFARHNSIVDALGPRVDPTLDGSGFDRTRLIKGLMFEAYFSHAISGHLAIRGITPSIPHWESTLQCRAGETSGDAVQCIIDGNRSHIYQISSQGVDLRLGNGDLTTQVRSWTRHLGEANDIVGDWWEDAGDIGILDGLTAQCGEAADLYMLLERYKESEGQQGVANAPQGLTRAPELLDTLGYVVPRVAFVRSVAGDIRSNLMSEIQDGERYLVSAYNSLYPQESRHSS